MRIGINAKMFENDNKTGIPIGVENDLKSWNKNHPENDYYLFSRKEIHLSFLLNDNWHCIQNPIKLDKILSKKNKILNKIFGYIYNNFTLPMLIKKYHLDVFWGPSFFLPPKVKGTYYFATIHDMSAFRFKNVVTFYDRITRRIFLPKTCRAADMIITVSNFSAKEICYFLKLPEEKVYVSYSSGIYKEKKLIDRKLNMSSYRTKFRIEDKFILFISTIEPRKNVITLIKAFEQYMEKYNDNICLVLAGGRGWKCDEIYDTARNSKYSDKIKMPGYVSEEEKDFLLSETSVVVYPSLYEGFGIPVLEAYSYNKPLITTRVASLPEVAGDAAFYIDDPFDAHSLCEQIRNAIYMDQADRNILKEKMKNQLAKFSWDKNANEILSIFSKLTNE